VLVLEMDPGTATADDEGHCDILRGGYTNAWRLFNLGEVQGFFRATIVHAPNIRLNL
jgi:hypothetical protein